MSRGTWIAAMSRGTWIAAVLAVAGVATCLWQWQRYRELSSQSSQGAVTSRPAALPPSAAASQRQAPATRAPIRRKTTTLRVVQQPAKASWRKRRQEQQSLIRQWLGRRDDESAEDYRARLVPLVKTLLQAPRRRMAKRRARAEKAANISSEARERLDGIVTDLHASAVQITNDAVANGGLDPYAHNTAGALTYAGALAAAFEGGESRIGEVLSKSQLQKMADSGFNWTEYLGTTIPWEDLQAPPPPPQ